MVPDLVAACTSPAADDRSITALLKRNRTGSRRVALQLASRIAEKAARNRQRELEQARRESAERARELAQRLVTDRTGVEAFLHASFDDQWSSRAQPGAIADQWQHTHAWKEHSQVASEAVERIRAETAKRYGIDWMPRVRTSRSSTPCCAMPRTDRPAPPTNAVAPKPTP